MRIAVAGGTGVVGRHVVEAARARGHEVVALSRGNGQDLTTGAGLDEALAGADAVIDCSNVVAATARGSVGFFEPATSHLLAAEERAGVRHHVVLSIVGIDRVDYGYYAGKRRQEELALSGPVPTTVLRTTQFHEFPGQVMAALKGPVAYVPRMRVQPVAAVEVARQLVVLAEGQPQGRAPELAGPEVLELTDMARRLLEATGDSRRLVSTRFPGRGGKAMASGACLPTGDGPRGTLTFEQWLGSTAG